MSNEAELSALPSGLNPNVCLPFPNSGDFDNFLALGSSMSDGVKFQGDDHQPGNGTTITTSSIFQLQEGVAASGFQARNLNECLSITGVDNDRLETFDSTALLEMPFTTALPIHPPGGSEVQLETRHYCNFDGCNVSTRRYADLQRHMRLHSTSRHKCQFCLKEICNRPDKVKSHLEKYHKFNPTVLRDRHDLWE
jgi:hypothetical protein